jgi:hypothetical protein
MHPDIKPRLIRAWAIRNPELRALTDRHEDRRTCVLLAWAVGDVDVVQFPRHLAIAEATGPVERYPNVIDRSPADVLAERNAARAA